MISDLVRTFARLPASVVAYDLETSGLSAQYDQIFQIAALRTDLGFCDPVDPEDTLELRARRQPWIVPSPTAMVVTRMDPDALSCGLLHHRLVASAEEFFRSRPSIFLTYNGIKFDEHFLRHALFRSLRKPYLTQTIGSTRADLMLMAQAIWIIDPNAIVVPKGESSRYSFRLGNLCRANGIHFPDETAHDALADVRATLALARHLKSASPLLFDQTLALADKKYSASINRPGSAFYRAAAYGGYPSIRALGCVDHMEDDRNARVCIDLTIDPDEYLSLNAEGLRNWMAKRPGPVAVVRTNAHEMIFPLSQEMPTGFHSKIRSHPKIQELPHLSLLQERAARIASEADFIDCLHTVLAEKRVSEVSPFPDAQLYSGGFASDVDFRNAASVLDMPSSIQRAVLLQDLGDRRLREFASRILYEESSEHLDAQTVDRLNLWKAERLLGPTDAPWRTIATARDEIEKLLQSPDVDQARIARIGTWLSSLEANAAAAFQNLRR